VTYSSGHCSEIGVYRYIEGFLSLVSGRTVKLGDTSGAKGLLAACFLASLHAHQTCDKPGLSQTSKASVPTRSPAVFLRVRMPLCILASNDVEHFQGIGGRDLCRLGPRAFIDSATLKDRHQTLCSKTTIMPTISGGGDEYLTRQSDKALNGKMSVAYIGGPINAMR